MKPKTEVKPLFTARLEDGLTKEFKILCIRLGRRQNDVLAEAIQDILLKYEKFVRAIKYRMKPQPSLPLSPKKKQER